MKLNEDGNGTNSRHEISNDLILLLIIIAQSFRLTVRDHHLLCKPPQEQHVVEIPVSLVNKEANSTFVIQNADLCEDPNWEDHHSRSRTLGQH